MEFFAHRIKPSACHRILIGFAIKAYELCWQAIEKTKKQCFARQFIPAKAGIQKNSNVRSTPNIQQKPRECWIHGQAKTAQGNDRQ
jgi:hypothetical protein